MINHALKNFPETGLWLVFGTRTEDDLFLSQAFSDWEKKGVNIQTTLSRPSDRWKGKYGYVTEHLPDLPPEDTQYYLCGSQAMIEDVQKNLIKKGVKDSQIEFERFY